MKKIIIITAIILATISVFYYLTHPLGVNVQIKDHVFYVDVAITSAEKELGLGNRKSMKPDNGMLFVYDHSEQYRYWMKNMQFPIDILWIADNTIADITKNIPVLTPDPYKTYSPAVGVNKVLELNAGTVDRLNIKTGDTIHIRF